MHTLRLSVTTTLCHDLTPGTPTCCCVSRKASKESRTCYEAVACIFWPCVLRRCVHVPDLVFFLYVPCETMLVLLSFYTALLHSAVDTCVFVAQMCIAYLAVVVFHYMSSSHK